MESTKITTALDIAEHFIDRGIGVTALQSFLQDFQFAFPGRAELSLLGVLESATGPLTQSHSISLSTSPQALGFVVRHNDLDTFTHTYEYAAFGCL